MPWEWQISRYCEEFHCLPSAIDRELDVTPMHLLDHIIELRAYAHSYWYLDKPINERPSGPLMDLCAEIGAAVDLEELQEQGLV